MGTERYTYVASTIYLYREIYIRPCLCGPGIESQWRARFCAPVHTGPVVQSASYTMGTGSFPGVKRLAHGVNRPLHLALSLRKSRAIPLLPL